MTSTNPIGDLLHRAGQAHEAIWAKHESALTTSQFRVLDAVSREPGVSQKRLVELTGIDRSTIADVIARLVSRRLVTRKRTREDARAYAVTLTVLGQKAIEHARITERAIADELASVASQRDMDAVVRVLSRIGEMGVGP